MLWVRSTSPTDFSRRFAGAPATRIVDAAFARFGSRVVLTTSFGIQSAVLLHMVTRRKPGLPVIWIDTGYLPAETYRYAEELSDRLGLNLHVYQSSVSPARMEALYGRLWEREDSASLERYHHIRKVEPLERAFAELRATAWLAGVRREQTDFRRTLRTAERHNGVCKIHPLLEWRAEDVDAYFRRYDLPAHPLAGEGYRTVGDAHLSRPTIESDTGERDSRFAGRAQECGIHVPAAGRRHAFGRFAAGSNA
jgi:phosphoadenosine phosphosulfate reductase